MYEASVAPVKEGDELDVMIEAVGEKGDGIAKVEGFVLFVAGTRQGENVTVRVTKVLRNVGFAEVVSRNAAAKEERKEKYVETVEAAPEPEPTHEDTEDFGEE